MLRDYECLGGPMDGSRVARSPDGFGAFCFGDRSKDGSVTMHFYRLCITNKRLAGRMRTAKFWHYIGTNPNALPRPTLSPHRRLYQ